MGRWGGSDNGNGISEGDFDHVNFEGQKNDPPDSFEGQLIDTWGSKFCPSEIPQTLYFSQVEKKTFMVYGYL